MDWYDCTICGQTLSELGGYDEVDGKIICQTCLVSENKKDKFEEIKRYFSKQSDWSTLTEFEYFQWLIQEVETLRNLLQYERVMHERSKDHFVKVKEKQERLEKENEQLKKEISELQYEIQHWMKLKDEVEQLKKTNY